MRLTIIRLTVLASAVAISGHALAQGAGGPPPAPPVTVAKPVVKEIQEQVSFTGRFDATQSVQIKSRVAGYLQQVSFVDGARVKKGDVLFQIDPRPYQAAFDQAAAAVTVSETTLQFASGDLDRATQLQKTGNITEQVFDQRRQAYQQAQAKLAGDRAALAAAKLNLEFTLVKAPIAGRMSRTLVSEGTLVAANDTLLTTIVSLNPIDFYFDVDERRLLSYAREARLKGGVLQEGGSLEVSVVISDAKEKPFKGKLDFAENRVDRETGTMRLRARFDNPDFVLQPGLFGRILVEGSNHYRGILIPDEAIGSDLDQRVVYVVGEDGLVSTKPVRLGPRLHGYRVIREGMTGDETIVVNGLMRIRPGVKVDPQLIELPPEAKSADTDTPESSQ